MITAEQLSALMYDLPILVAACRNRRGLTMRAAALQIGVVSSTIHRVERGVGCDVDTLILILDWLHRE